MVYANGIMKNQYTCHGCWVILGKPEKVKWREFQDVKESKFTKTLIFKPRKPRQRNGAYMKYGKRMGKTP